MIVVQHAQELAGLDAQMAVGLDARMAVKPVVAGVLQVAVQVVLMDVEEIARLVVVVVMAHVAVIAVLIALERHVRCLALDIVQKYAVVTVRQLALKVALPAGLVGCAINIVLENAAILAITNAMAHVATLVPDVLKHAEAHVGKDAQTIAMVVAVVVQEGALDAVLIVVVLVGADAQQVVVEHVLNHAVTFAMIAVVQNALKLVKIVVKPHAMILVILKQHQQVLLR